MNTASWLQQAWGYAGVANVTTAQQNEPYDDHKTINSGEKSTIHCSLHPSHGGMKCVVRKHMGLTLPFDFEANVAHKGLLYSTLLALTSTLVGQHSTARLSMILASSGSSNSTAAFHKRTEFGTCSRATEAKQSCQALTKMFPPRE